MAGMMSGNKGMGAARMKGRFGKKKGKKAPPFKKDEKESAAETPSDEAAEIKKRMHSETT